MRRALALLLVAACGCAHPHGNAASVAAARAGTKLVVLLVVDQWPEWSFEQKRAELAAQHGGFERLASEGEWHVGRHPSAATLTAPGHALLGSGEPAARSGILANEWWHRDVGRELGSTEGEDGAVTAKWLRVPALGDAIAASHDGARAVGVSLKSRAALLPLGHNGLAIWFDIPTAKWLSSASPAWLDAYNAKRPVEPRLHEPWKPLDPDRIARLAGVPDAQPGEVGEHGFGATFPHDPQATPTPAAAVYTMPLGDELVLDAAVAAIDGEHLGSGSAPDLLVVSLSAHDFVGHGWGHESWEMWDLELRLDAQLSRFFAALDERVGADHWAMVVTSDHGASPMPEKLSGGRLTHHQIQVAANTAASAVLGTGQWIDNAHYPNVYFSHAMLAQPKGELASAEQRVIYALRSFPGLARVDRVDRVAGHCEARVGDERALCLSFDPERSGDVFYIPAKGWIMESEDERHATAHGSLEDYDRLVPLWIVPPGRTRHTPQTAPLAGEVDMTDVSTLLAHWLGVTPPLDLPRPPPEPPAAPVTSPTGN